MEKKRVGDYDLDSLLGRSMIFKTRRKKLPIYNDMGQSPIWRCISIRKNLQQSYLVLRCIIGGEKISVGEGTEIWWISDK